MLNGSQYQSSPSSTRTSTRQDGHTQMTTHGDVKVTVPAVGDDEPNALTPRAGRDPRPPALPRIAQVFGVPDI